jgi:hypothetical protein
MKNQQLTGDDLSEVHFMGGHDVWLYAKSRTDGETHEQSLLNSKIYQRLTTMKE